MSARDTCVVCNDGVRPRQEALQCDACDRWQHRKCQTGISRDDYRRLVRGDLDVFMWRCRDCSIVIPGPVESFHGRIPLAESTGMDVDMTELRDPEEMEMEMEIRPSSFNVGLPVAEVPPQVMEDSIEPQPIPGDILEDAPTTYEVVAGGSQKGADIIIDSLGFTYVRKRVSTISTTWACSMRAKKCSATVKQQGTAFSRGPREHNHGGDPGAQLRTKARTMIKQAAIKDPYKASGKIVTETLQTLEGDGDVLPAVNHLQRSANRARQNLRPAHPTDPDFQLAMAHLPENFLQSDISHDDQRHLVLATPTQLSSLLKAKIWFIDGTFKVAREPFVQMLSIHSYIKSGESVKQVPLCFILMTRRKKKDYEVVFDAILRLLPSEPAVTEVVVDFERAVWSALHKSLPAISVHGCWFHWAQAVYRKVKEVGLRSAYTHQLPVRAFLRELMALPNLPGNHIAPAFLELKARCPTTPSAVKIQEMLQYMEKTWVSSTSRPPASWTTFKRPVRTNNDAEGWHNRLNRQAPHDRMNLYLLIQLLHDEALLLPLQVRLVAQHKLYRHQSKVAKSKQESLKKLWQEYEKADRTMTTSEYLRRCSELTDHSED